MSNLLVNKKKIRLSYYISENMLLDIKDNMIKNGYDLKGKSKWISEAITSLFQLNNYIDLVYINEQMKGFEKLDSSSVEGSLKKQLDLAVIDIRKIHPSLEGVLSKIIRTAIIQRLLQH